MPNQRARKNEVHVFMDDKEFAVLTKKAAKAGLPKSALIRMLIQGYSPKEKPDDRFYIVMRQLIGIGNNMQQICRKANALNFIDAPALKKALENLDALEAEVSKRFLDPERSG
jgi:hypothetical protein